MFVRRKARVNGIVLKAPSFCFTTETLPYPKGWYEVSPKMGKTRYGKGMAQLRLNRSGWLLYKGCRRI